MIRCLIFCWIVSWGVVAQFPAALAEEAEVTLKAAVDRATLTIGDPVEYTITVRHRPAVEILTALPAPDTEVLSIEKIDDIRQEDGGMIVEGKKFTMTTFRLGEFVLEPVTIEYKTSDGQIKSVSTSPIYLNVKSVDAGKEKNDIRAIKTVRSIKGSNTVPTLIAVFALVTVVFFAWMYYFARRRLKALKEPEPDLTPEEEALQHLTQLYDSDFLRKGRAREYFFRMSEVMKRYFERRVGIPATEATTYEILLMLREKNIDGVLMEHVQDLLENADFVKFAKWVPSPPEIIALNQKAKQIVEDFRPKNTEAGRDI